MEAEIFYLIKGTILLQGSRNNETFEPEIVFKDENPVQARKLAFQKFQDFVELFLEGIGKKYSSYEKAVIQLNDYLSSNKTQYFLNNPDLPINVDADKWLGIYMVITDSKTHQTKEGITVYEDKELIHYLGTDINDMKQKLLESLMIEYGLFEEFEYNMGDLKTKVDTRGKGEEDDIVEILQTSINFDCIFK